MKNIQEKYIQPGEWLVNACAVTSLGFAGGILLPIIFTAGFGWSSAWYFAADDNTDFFYFPVWPYGYQSQRKQGSHFFREIRRNCGG